jgi:MFS family permease
MPSSGAFRALEHRGFRNLWLANAVGDLGFWISYISLQWQMSRETDSDPSWLGLLFFTNFVPMLVFAPVAGVVADRVDRRRMIVIGRLCVAVLAGGLCALTATGSISAGLLLVFAAGFGTVFAFMAPAGQAVVANTVPLDDLASAVSLQSAGTNVFRVSGPALAAPILAAWGAGVSFGLYTLANIITAIVVARLPLPRRERVEFQEPMWRQFAAGLAHARERRPAGLALLTMGAFSIFGAAHVVLFPVLAKEVFHRGDTAFTGLVIASGIGAIAGALTTGTRQGLPQLSTAARHLMTFGAILFGFAYLQSWVAALAVAVVIGFFYFSVTTTLNSLLQHLADDDKRGRIMSLFTLTWAGLVPIGGLWMGSAADQYGARTTIAIGAIVCIACGAAVLIRSRVPTLEEATA